MIVLLKSENYFFLYSPKVRKIFIYRKTNQVVQKLGKKCICAYSTMEKFIIKWVKIISGQIINLHKTKSKILVLASILNVYNFKKKKE